MCQAMHTGAMQVAPWHVPTMDWAKAHGVPDGVCQSIKPFKMCVPHRWHKSPAMCSLKQQCSKGKTRI